MSPVTVLCLFSPQPCLQYWPEPGLQHYGPMEVEYVSGAADEDIVSRLFRVQNITRVRHGVGWGGHGVGRGAPRVAVCNQVPPVRVTGGAFGEGWVDLGKGWGTSKGFFMRAKTLGEQKDAPGEALQPWSLVGPGNSPYRLPNLWVLPCSSAQPSSSRGCSTSCLLAERGLQC